MHSVLVVSLAIVSAATWVFSLSRISSLPAFTIDSVNIYGARSGLAPSLQVAAVGAMGGNYLGIFSRANSFIYPKRGIKLAIESASPEVEDVSVQRDGLNKLSVSVKERIPAATVCANLPDFENGSISFNDSEECYVADGNSLIWKAASSSDTDGVNRYYMPDLHNRASAVIGSYASSTAGFSALQDFYDGVKRIGIDAQAVLVKDDGQYELYADSGSSLASSTAAGQTMIIYFNERASFRAELANLADFWKDVTKDRQGGRTKRFSDIKLQYPPQVVYTEIK
jgi:hypothetical protein